MSSNVWSGIKEFTAVSGEETVVEISTPHRGSLRGYTLIQTNGNPDGIEAALYTSDAAPEELYHLIDLSDVAEVTEDSDVVAILENTALDVAYVNRKGTPTNPERILYLKITPTGTGSKNFAISLTVETTRVR